MIDGTEAAGDTAGADDLGEINYDGDLGVADAGGDAGEGDGEEANDDGQDGQDEADQGEGDDAGDLDGDDEGEGEDEGEDEPEPDPKPKKESGSARWRRRALEAEARIAATAEPVQLKPEQLHAAVEAEIGARPTEADFPGDYLAFERASTAWEAAKLSVQPALRRQAQSEHVKELAAAELKIEDFRDRSKEAAKAIPDYQATVKAAKAPMAPHVMREIIDSEKGPLLAYHLAKNPDQAAKLNSMTPVQLAREIGRLEGQVRLPTAKKATSAPAPLSTPRGSAKATSDPSRMSMADYAKWRASQ